MSKDEPYARLDTQMVVVQMCGQRVKHIVSFVRSMFAWLGRLAKRLVGRGLLQPPPIKDTEQSASVVVYYSLPSLPTLLMMMMMMMKMMMLFAQA